MPEQAKELEGHRFGGHRKFTATITRLHLSLRVSVPSPLVLNFRDVKDASN